MEKLTILHTNDVHSHFENWPRIRRYLLDTGKTLRQAGQTVLTFDLGDHVDRVHPVSEATNGQKNVELMNQVHYDAVTIGNNEGLGFSRPVLDHLYDHANFDVVLGNLRTLDDQRPEWALDHKLITTPTGTRVLVLGFTAPYQLTYPLAGWTVYAVEPILKQQLTTFAGQYDVLILLSHLGLDVDRQLAKRHAELTVIIGSHTHHLLPHGERVNQSLLAAAGKYGQYIGQISLTLDDEHRVIDRQAQVIQTASLPTQPADQAEIEGLRDLGEVILSDQRVARIPTDMEAGTEGHPRLLREGLRAIEEDAHVEAAILNAGLFLTDLPKGVVTRQQLHQMLPHNIRVMTVTLSGYDLWRMIQEMELARRFLLRFPIKGMGFRGQVFGAIRYDGLTFDEQTHAVYWHGDPLNPTQVYTVGMIDHYLFIPFFPTISIAGTTNILYDSLLRDVFAQYLTKHYPID